MNSLYQLSAVRNDGRIESLGTYRGKLLLIVNTASECGFTPQYRGLQQLYEKYAIRGFEILAFPCNQFAHQEPGTDEEIYAFCQRGFGVTFPLFKKTEVNGENAHPIFVYLKKKAPGFFGRKIKWNFTKFLVDQNGKVLKRYAPATPPAKLEVTIERLLG